MGQCELCGNFYDKTFDVVLAERLHTFDSFECAIEALAPRCSHCGCRVIGHGVEAGGDIYCCAHCAKQMGEPALRDRAPDDRAAEESRPTPEQRPSVA